MSMTVTFEVGVDLDMANVLLQNRVALAEPKLPEEVRRLGITVKKKIAGHHLRRRPFIPKMAASTKHS